MDATTKWEFNPARDPHVLDEAVLRQLDAKKPSQPTVKRIEDGISIEHARARDTIEERHPLDA